MNLAEKISDLESIEGVIHSQHVSDAYGGTVVTYRFWKQVNSVIFGVSLRILVKYPGTPQEEAIEYNRGRLETAATPFKDAVEAAMPGWLTSNPLIEHVELGVCNEAEEYAFYRVLEKAAAEDQSTLKTLVVFRSVQDGALKVRELLNPPEG